MEFATKPMIITSFRGARLYAPLPQDTRKWDKENLNHGQRMYQAYLNRDVEQTVLFEIGGVEMSELSGNMSYIQWARHQKLDKNFKAISARPTRGVGCQKELLGLAVRFPFELLDNFVGAWAAMFVPHAMDTKALRAAIPAVGIQAIPQQDLWKTQEAAVGTQYLKSLISAVPGGFERLKMEMMKDLVYRGLPADRIKTFKSRLEAYKILMDHIDEADTMEKKKALVKRWDAKRVTKLEEKIWSATQKQVLDRVAQGIKVADANVPPHSRFLFVTGGPGTGKTEAVLHSALGAAKSGCKVLIACPIGALVSVYKKRIPADYDIAVETIHSSFKITRKADAQYIPPGRLRHYDLIIFDESSQVEDNVWREMRTALSELSPGPFVVFVGDFQQLQPVKGKALLRETLNQQVQDGLLYHIELEQHEFARCTDEAMLDFLTHVRTQQPSRFILQEFFRNRIMDRGLANAIKKSIHLEELLHQAEGQQKYFTFLTVSNKAARTLNLERLKQEHGVDEKALQEQGSFGDDTAGGGKMIFKKGMRIRLTRNLDKDRGFVNGALGVIDEMLSREGEPPVFVLKTVEGTLLLVHYVFIDGKKFMPCTYGYAMTIRRAQGSTLDMGALYFDRKLPDRGYAYVGASRFRSHEKLYLLGLIRRTDWKPVGGDPKDEQMYPSILSESDSDNDQMEEEMRDEKSDYDSESDEEYDGEDDDFVNSLQKFEAGEVPTREIIDLSALFGD